MNTKCRIDFRTEGKIDIIDILDSITNDVAVDISEQVIQHTVQSSPIGILLSLKGDSISSLGIGCIIAIYHDLLDKDIKLVVNSTQKIRKIFVNAKLHLVLDMFTDEEVSIHHIKYLTHQD